MKIIKLMCATLGYKFGDVVKVGAGKEEISLKDAKELVVAGHAIEVRELIVANAKDMEVSIKELTAKLDLLTQENLDLTAKLDLLTQENLDLTAKLTKK